MQQLTRVNYCKRWREKEVICYFTLAQKIFSSSRTPKSVKKQYLLNVFAQFSWKEISKTAAAPLEPGVLAWCLLVAACDVFTCLPADYVEIIRI